MHIAAYKMVTGKTLPALRRLRDAIDQKSQEWKDVVKIGRTHLEDATPLTVGQEWSGYKGALDDSIANLEYASAGLLQVAMGGTAVGTGLNSPVGFGDDVAAQLTKLTGFAIKTADNKFTAQGTLDRMVRAHAALKTAAVSCFKIANDMRWLGSGPRAGIHEAHLSGKRTGFIDHAGQDQSDASRGDAHGRDRNQRCRHRDSMGRRRRQLRADAFVESSSRTICTRP